MEFTHPITYPSGSILALLKCVDESYNNSTTRIADCMSKSNSTTTKTVRKIPESQRTRYPLTFTLAGSSCNIFSAARTTTENASLISNSEMSEMDRFAFSSASGRAIVGAIGNSIGATPASA